MEQIKKQINNFIMNCSEKDIIFDIKTIMSDFFNGVFFENENSLNLLLDDGQMFVISVEKRFAQ